MPIGIVDVGCSGTFSSSKESWSRVLCHDRDFEFFNCQNVDFYYDMDNFKVPSGIPQDLLLIQSIVGITEQHPQSLSKTDNPNQNAGLTSTDTASSDSSIASSGSELDSEDEIENELKAEEKDPDVVKTEDKGDPVVKTQEKQNP